MRQDTIPRRARGLRIGVPAAVLGTLAGSLAGTAASADASVVTTALPDLPATRAVPTAATPTSHIVQPGDTLIGIADRYDLRTVDLLSWNDLTWRSVIHPGQKILLHGPSAPTVTSDTGATHVVAAGDTVWAIARAHGTTVAAVLAANGLSSDSVILPGQTLRLGAAAPASASAPPAAPSTPVTDSHVVVAGDTLIGIATRYGVRVADLFSWNALDGSSIIYPGQRVVVTAPPSSPASASSGQRSADLDAEQTANVVLIIGIGRDLGVSDRAIAIALATAMTESSLRNLDHGDRDSLGLFQQRPSTGWGTPEQITDAERSTRVFFGGASDPNGDATRGLLDIDGWQDLGFSDAAQAVQISDYPLSYGRWETQAYQWIATHG